MSARDWFSEFATRYKERASNPESDIAISDDKDHSAEWTAVMGLFLKRMARDSGFRQRWEVPVPIPGKSRSRKLDFGWHDPQVSLAVAIEHHSWFNDSQGYADKVITVLMSHAPLGILITYVQGKESPNSDTVREGVQGMLKADPRPPSEFLLVLGDQYVASETPWWGFAWDAVTSTVQPVKKE